MKNFNEHPQLMGRIINLRNLILALIFVGNFLFLGCTQVDSDSTNKISKNRIKLKEVRIINRVRYSIIEVDSVEYLTQDNGGFIQISK
ncbi:hypothetical protein JZU46_02005 [bacterium]|jgi:hypothetical protein|nr:hypothetical protein [bacterium]